MQRNENPSRSQSTVRRAYRALLRLMPFEFRAEFGRDMEQAFSDEREDLRMRRNRVETVRFWLRTIKNFARTAPRQHSDSHAHARNRRQHQHLLSRLRRGPATAGVS